MAFQALGERAALEGFWVGVSDAMVSVLDLAQEHIYVVIGVLVVAAYFLLRKR
jgi:hypothetical protein